MVKVLYNNCFGGFGLSKEAVDLYLAKGGDPKASRSYSWDAHRSDPILIEAVEEIGLEKAASIFGSLSIEEIPAGVEYRIDEYDGNERVMTIDDYEWQVA